MYIRIVKSTCGIIFLARNVKWLYKTKSVRNVRPIVVAETISVYHNRST